MNSGSTGRIAEDIGKVLLDNAHESYIAYGRGNQSSASQLIKIGTKMDIYRHGLVSLVYDKHGLGSEKATIELNLKIRELKPDVIHLHNIHGYYINYRFLFNQLKVGNASVIWTFHDCWPFTGHCAYFDQVNCNKWETECHTCPLTNGYPKSLGWVDNSTFNFRIKKATFLGMSNLTLVTPSHWLSDLVGRSFLRRYPLRTIHNGIDLDVFKPVKSTEDNRPYVLGVASIWDKRKGLADFIALRKELDKDLDIVMIGLTQRQVHEVKKEGIIGIKRTENLQELVKWYSGASYFINPTYLDNFPTTNIEALACGTPVITYRTGGSPEALDEKTGHVLEQGDIQGIKNLIEKQTLDELYQQRKDSRKRAEENFNKNDRFRDYLNLYQQVLNNHNSILRQNLSNGTT